MQRVIVRTLFFLSILFLFFIPVFSQSRDFSSLDAWLKENTAEMGGRSVLMIWQEGKVIYSHAVNDMSPRQKIAANLLARRQGKTANTADFTTSVRQPIASCSKWLSAALVMTFVDEGKLRLTDSVGKFLPELSRHGKGNITIEQCLSHTTGIKAPSLKESLEEMRTIASMEEAIGEIAALPMEGQPGKVFHYSNVGLQIAAAVIEAISGNDFETLFAERIARPLDMKNTDFGKGNVPLPAGGALSTPQDYLNFLVMILNKGVYNGKRILSENSLAAMQTDRITTDVKIAYSPGEAGDAGYGLGEWVLDEAAIGNLSKTVSSPGLFGSFPWVDNEKQYCAFLMTYYVKPEGRNERYKELKGLVDRIVN